MKSELENLNFLKKSKLNYSFADIQVIGNDIDINVPTHPLDRKLKEAKLNTPKTKTPKITINVSSIDITDLKDRPYSRCLRYYKQTKKKEGTIDILQQNLPPDNDTFYIEHEPSTNTFSIKKRFRPG